MLGPRDSIHIFCVGSSSPTSRTTILLPRVCTILGEKKEMELGIGSRYPEKDMQMLKDLNHLEMNLCNCVLLISQNESNWYYKMFKVCGTWNMAQESLTSCLLFVEQRSANLDCHWISWSLWICYLELINWRQRSTSFIGHLLYSGSSQSSPPYLLANPERTGLPPPFLKRVKLRED